MPTYNLGDLYDEQCEEDFDARAREDEDEQLERLMKEEQRHATVLAAMKTEAKLRNMELTAEELGGYYG